MLDIFSVRKEYDMLRAMVKHDPYIHSSDSLREAQIEVHWNYNRPPGYLHDMLDGELKGSKELVGASDDKIAGTITELCLLDRLNWLRDERGWNITYLDKPFENRKYIVVPGKPGKRVDVYKKNGDGKGGTGDEFDAAALIEGTWTLVEGKTRGNFNVDDIMTKIRRFNNVVVKRSGKEGPAAIVGFADNHRSRYALNVGKFRNKGGNIWTLKGFYSDYLSMLVNEYRNTPGEVESEAA